jgi:hypothetical protein
MTARRKALMFAAQVARVGKELIETMTAPIPDTIPAPSVSELRDRRAALVGAIAAARAAFDSARAEQDKELDVVAASKPEDNESEDNARILWLAQQQVRVDISERRHAKLLTEFQALDGVIALAERTKKEHRKAALEVVLNDNSTSNTLIPPVVKAAEALVLELLKVREHNESREKLRAELAQICEELRCERPSLVTASHWNTEVSWGVVAAGLQELAQGESDPAKRGYLLSLAGAQVNLRTN